MVCGVKVTPALWGNDAKLTPTSIVGNAKLEGLLVDLKITDPSAYNTGLALYFVRSFVCFSHVPN
jgi:hypothetical protein